MSADRAAVDRTLERGERRAVARIGLLGFFHFAWEIVPDPWMPAPSPLAAILERARDAETPAKPVGGVSRPPDSAR